MSDSENETTEHISNSSSCVPVIVHRTIATTDRQRDVDDVEIGEDIIEILDSDDETDNDVQSDQSQPEESGVQNIIISHCYSLNSDNLSTEEDDEEDDMIEEDRIRITIQETDIGGHGFEGIAEETNAVGIVISHSYSLMPGNLSTEEDNEQDNLVENDMHHETHANEKVTNEPNLQTDSEGNENGVEKDSDEKINDEIDNSSENLKRKIETSESQPESEENMEKRAKTENIVPEKEIEEQSIQSKSEEFTVEDIVIERNSSLKPDNSSTELENEQANLEENDMHHEKHANEKVKNGSNLQTDSEGNENGAEKDSDEKIQGEVDNFSENLKRKIETSESQLESEENMEKRAKTEDIEPEKEIEEQSHPSKSEECSVEDIVMERYSSLKPDNPSTELENEQVNLVENDMHREKHANEKVTKEPNLQTDSEENKNGAEKDSGEEIKDEQAIMSENVINQENHDNENESVKTEKETGVMQ